VDGCYKGVNGCVGLGIVDLDSVVGVNYCYLSLLICFELYLLPWF